MSNLVPSLVPLNKGLDLQSPKVTAEAGTILDTLNYEQVDFQGQKRIDGFVRYDGSTTSAFDEWYVLFTDSIGEEEGGDTPEIFLASHAEQISRGEVLLQNSSGRVFGKIVGQSFAGTLDFVRLDEKALPAAGETAYVLMATVGELLELTVTNIRSAADIFSEAPATEAEQAEVHYETLLTKQREVRTTATKLPGPVSGLHWFVDRLYAVSDLLLVTVSVTGGTLYPNDLLILANPDILWSDAAAEVLAVYSSSEDTKILVGTASSHWYTSAQTAAVIDRSTGTPTGTEVEILQVSCGLVSSLFESRTEQQVLGEDPEPVAELFGDTERVLGWRFKHLGWKIPYENGSSLYGSLPSLNQNIEGLGVQGPTSISGNSGKPTMLVQNVNIADKKEQVNGWKSSQTPSSYDLDVDNITSIDDTFIYADAFISWTADSTVINSPGLTTNTLEARDAEASVIIETA